jgi:predicted TIM-barrel fold metal-dependent hydrolase
VALNQARVFNDYAHEVFADHQDRIALLAAVPLTNVADAVIEVERVANMGFRGITVPLRPPQPYASDAFDAVWAAAQGHGLPVTFHAGTGFDPDDDEEVARVGAGVVSMMSMTPASSSFADRLLTQEAAADHAKRAIISLVGSGVMERFPDLHFVSIESNAHWMASMMGAMDKACSVGIGQDDTWATGYFDGDRPVLRTAFEMNRSWPYPLRPSEYVRRQVHATFMDDPIAVAARHLTGIDALLWGNDYPHAEGTYPHSQEAVDALFDGVEPADRAAIVGGNAATIFGLTLPVAA